MKIAGIIAEYNPFHNGHSYHLQKTREHLGADYCIVVMSGDYVQRGTPALLEKHTRAQMALSCGADLVLELPVEFATGSAEYFAYGAVNLLDSLNVVTHLSFGSEAGELPFFQAISQVLVNEPPDYQESLRVYLKEGLSFPAARSLALHGFFQRHAFRLPFSLEEMEKFLKNPNNILGVEYCKALKLSDSMIQPFTIRREGCSYHETRLDENFCSATAIRQYLQSGQPLEALSKQMPAPVFRLLAESVKKGETLDMDDFSLLLKYCLLTETPSGLISYADVSEDLARRIYNRLNQFESFRQFTALLKTKELTQTRIQRSLLHVLLKIREYPNLSYARILGMKKDSAPLLSLIKQRSRIPLVSKVSQADFQKNMEFSSTVTKNTFASNLWESVVCAKTGRPFIHEFEKPIVTL